jgi:hypothetical protein
MDALPESEDSKIIAEVFAMLKEIYDAREALVFLQSPCGLLDGATPHDVMERGEPEKVRDMLRRLLDGAYI